ncbi:MAG: DUF1573 domain-containing protein [Planctomycetaceae bacterium]|nr:DUF1573 domain-containing protein [Planctomycetaceae bacterium]
MRLKRSTWLLYLCIALSATSLGAAVAYRYSIAPEIYQDDWVRLSRAIDASADVHSPEVKQLLGEVGDAKALEDLGLVYALEDSLWVGAQQVTDSGVLHTFDVVNEERRPVRIVNIETSCGCSTAELSTRELRPGERTSLALRISHEKLSDGPHNYWATLATDSDSVWRYGVKVEIMRAVSWDRPDVYFGDVSSASPNEMNCELRLFQPPFLKTLKFDGVSVGSDHVRADVLPQESILRANGVVEHRVPVKLSLAPDGIREGHGFCYLTAAYSTDAGNGQAIARVHWTRISPYHVAPARLVLRDSDAAAPFTIVITHVSGLPFRVLSAEVPDYLLVTSGIGGSAAKEQTLTLWFDQARLPGQHRFDGVVLKTDLKADDVVTIPTVFLRALRTSVSQPGNPSTGEKR